MILGWLKPLIVSGFVCAIGILAGVACFSISQWQLSSAWNAYVTEAQGDIDLRAQRVGDNLRLIADNLRTISLLPGVRIIDRHATNLDENGKGAIQQVYNNLATAIAVSEVYITSENFKPGKIDVFSGKHEEPILMFDELIVESGRFAKELDPFASKAAAKISGEAAQLELPEEEEYEYVELVKHIDWMRRLPSSVRAADIKSLPVYSGGEMITCDNTDFVRTLKDADRMGVIFSVPFYKADGGLGGIVSAIVRSNALRDFLKSSDFVLTSPHDDFQTAFISKVNNNWQSWSPNLFKLNSGQVFNLRNAITTADPRGPWLLQGELSVDRFYQSHAFTQIRNFFAALMVAIAAITSLSLFWLITARRRAALLQHNAMHDSLTGLANRRHLDQHLVSVLENAKAGKKSLVHYLDLDRFKVINDTFGHQTGDSVIVEAARRIKSTVRNDDFVARIGGDEFVVVTSHGSHVGDVSETAEHIVEAFKDIFEHNGLHISMGTSIGVSVVDDAAATTDEIIRQADLALTRVKTTHRGFYKFYGKEIDAERERRSLIGSDIERAIKAGQFEVYYQFIVSAKTSALTGVEALLRWKHPKFGFISPAEFIPIAEHSGVINVLGEWVLNQACKDAMKLPDYITLSVNVSPLQLLNPTLPLHIITALQKSGLPSSRLELEFTEGLLIDPTEATLKTIDLIRECGVQIAIDDFGVGFSSLSYLQNFKFDRIKIDRTFINKIEEVGDLAILKAIADIGKSLNVSTTAEGVETEQQLLTVQSTGCTDVQGFLFSKPKPINEILVEIAKVENGVMYV